MYLDEDLKYSILDFASIISFSSESAPGNSTSGVTRSLRIFMSHHLTPLFPNHPSYPTSNSVCSIREDPFGVAHPPMLVADILGYVGHVYGYEWMRRWMSSGLPNSNECPLCRTLWFDIAKTAQVELGRAWARIYTAETSAAVEEQSQHHVSGNQMYDSHQIDR